MSIATTGTLGTAALQGAAIPGLSCTLELTRRPPPMVRNSHQDALADAQFDNLVAAAETLEPPFDAEAMMILYAGGRLGMRAGEICHLKESWIDWEKKHIENVRGTGVYEFVDDPRDD